MSITNGYVHLAEIRGELGITDATDMTDDSRLENAVEAASRAIDNECGQRFYLDSTATARYYTAEDSDYLRIHPVGLVTSFAIATDEDGDRTYETTWASTDYDMLPDNASADGRPWTALQTTPNGQHGFPGLRRGVKVTAFWGWPSVPAAIKRATMIQAVRLYKRRDAVFGQTGSPETGVMTLPALDPDVKRLIAPYRVVGIGGA